MECTFKGKKISGMLGILPEQVSYFDDEVDNYAFPPKQTKRLKKVMGFEKHRLAKETSTASDFCVYGLNHLLESEQIKKEEIGAIIVVTLSPDYFLPHISNIIHGKLELPSEVLCMDIPQGCCGFLLGLIQAFMLLDIMHGKKIVLCNTDVLSHKVSRKDRNEFPVIGDVTTITIIESSDLEDDIHARIYMDGTKRETLMIPAGGFAMPSTEKTAELKLLEDGNYRALDHLHMDGTGVFNFVQLQVPPMLQSLFEDTGLCVEDIDYFLFHQPNNFMLKKLADKAQIPYEKMFMNIVENYGNPSGASIPLNIIHNMRNMVVQQKYYCCLSAFGSGLAWGGMLMNLGNMDFCEMIGSDL